MLSQAAKHKIKNLLLAQYFIHENLTHYQKIKLIGNSLKFIFENQNVHPGESYTPVYLP
jgi:hypothetical protein